MAKRKRSVICGKKMYVKEQAAKEAARQSSMKFEKPFRYYFCNICLNFHLTSSMRKGA